MVTAWIAEESEWTMEGGLWFTGRFWASTQDGVRAIESVHDLAVDDALAWARERASKVLIRFGKEDYYSAGAQHPKDAPRWPPNDLPVLARRRATGDQ